MAYLLGMPRGRKMHTLFGTSIKQHPEILLMLGLISDHVHLHWQLLYGRKNNVQNNNHGQSEKKVYNTKF